MHKRIYGLSM